MVVTAGRKYHLDDEMRTNLWRRQMLVEEVLLGI